MLRRTMLGIPVVAALAMGSLTATAVAEPEVSHVPGEVHLATFGSPGATGVAHTVRRGDGNWYGFGYLGTSHSQRQLVSAIVGGEEHLLYEDYSGLPYRPWLHHRIRHADGSWSEVVGSPDTTGSTTDLAVAAVAGELHRVRRNSGDDTLRHNVRHADGTWSETVAIPALSSPTSNVAIAGVGGDLRLLVDGIGGDTVIVSYVRHADGTWEQTPDVPFTPPVAGVTAVNVEVAQVGTELHAAVTGSDGRLYHAAQRSNGAWTGFHDIASQTGVPRGTVTSAAITAARGTLHVAVTTSEGRILHTIRSGDGRWRPFGDVLDATGSPSLTPNGLTIAGS